MHLCPHVDYLPPNYVRLGTTKTPNVSKQEVATSAVPSVLSRIFCWFSQFHISSQRDHEKVCGVSLLNRDYII